MSGILLCFLGFAGHIEPFKNTRCYIECKGNEEKTQIMLLIFYYLPYTASLIFNITMVYKIISFSR